MSEHITFRKVLVYGLGFVSLMFLALLYYNGNVTRTIPQWIHFQERPPPPPYQMLNLFNSTEEVEKNTSHGWKHTFMHDLSDVHYKRANDPLFWDSRPTPIHVAFEQHRWKTRATCNNKCEEIKTIKNASAACLAKTFEEWYDIQLKGEMPHVPFLLRGQYVFQWEKDYLSYPPLTNLSDLPDLQLSKVSLAGVREGTVACNISQTLFGRVDLIDGHGRQRKAGGDELRVWLTDVGKKTYAVTGNVTDLKNGSYAFSITPFWSGLSSLHVAVAHSREFLRTVVHQSHIGVTRYIAGLFRRGSVSEHTICWTTPNIPGRPCICNITSLHQATWYCGRPLDKRLTCRDWVASQGLFLSPPQFVTLAEKEMIRTGPALAKDTCIKHNLQVNTTNTGKLPSLKPCRDVGPEVTWTLDKPRGYWTNNTTSKSTSKRKWHSLLCLERKLNAAASWLLSCLRDTKVWIFGDSNGVRLYNSLASLVSCQKVIPSSWPGRAKCENEKKQITIDFLPHEYPLFLIKRMTKRFPFGGVAWYIDQQIPSEGKVILIVHYFLHYTPSHYSVLYSRLVALRDAVQRLLKRNPRAVIGLRGPHVITRSWAVNFSIGESRLGPFYIQMVKGIFLPLKRNVIFLDGWDMTIGLENSDNHPSNIVPHHMLQTLFSFVCD